MTRLNEKDIKQIGRTLHAYDAGLAKKTGYTLKQIAMRAAGLSEREMDEALASARVAVFPVTCGQGIIRGFAGAVESILRHLGAKIFQGEASDIGGLAEVVERGADIVFAADDQKFIALHLSAKSVIDNAEATARGYVEALGCIAGGLEGRDVLVLGGAGRVGWHAVCALGEKGAKVAIYDPDRRRSASRVKGRDIIVEDDLEKALRRHLLLFDASPAVKIIRSEHIKPSTVIAAPGIPLGLTEGAYDLVKDRLIHDRLQIGVATMLAEALAG
jgi:pyrrolysine biosynthesis protein PylD